MQATRPIKNTHIHISKNYYKEKKKTDKLLKKKNTTRPKHKTLKNSYTYGQKPIYNHVATLRTVSINRICEL